MPQDTTNQASTILFLSHARTASHVLARMLSKQPNTLYGSHWFHAARTERRSVIEAGPIEEVDPAIIGELMSQLEGAYLGLVEFLDDAQRQGKIAFAHTQPHSMLSPKLMSDWVCGRGNSSRNGELGPWVVGPVTQPHTNPIVVPDSVLLRPSTIPIINFCHPVLICERLMRGFRTQPAFRADALFHKLVTFGGNVHWQRLVYEWYLEHGIEPILLDADDYLGPDKEILMRKLCDRIPGFDFNSIIYNWPKTTSEELAKMPEHQQQAYKTILASDHIQSGHDMRGRDVDSEISKFEDLWGQDDAEFLRSLVDKAMPDYEFLRAHRMRPDDSSQ